MLAAMKKMLKATPVVGPLLTKLRGDSFRTSGEYWEQRYQHRHNSGAGSYNRLAEFKAEFLNGFVEENRIGSVLEFGCGDGAQLKLAHYPQYIGVDISPTAVHMCRSIFAGDAGKSFYCVGELPAGMTAELTLSLDVIYHLVEDEIFEAYMRELFLRSERYVIVYASNRDEPWHARHVRHRQFTNWVERNEPDWRLASMTPNRYPYEAANPDQTSFADFFVFERNSVRAEQK